MPVAASNAAPALELTSGRAGSDRAVCIALFRALLLEHTDAHLVDDDGKDQQAAKHDLLLVALDAQQIHTVRHQRDENRAEDHVADPADAAEERYPADDDGRDRL